MWYFQKADLIIAPLTITYERQTVIHFTKPFMDLGLTFMMPQAMLEEDIWSFHKPFAPELWAALLLVLVITAASLTLCSTFSPYGYAGGFTQRLNPLDRMGEAYKNSFDFANSLWHCLGSIMHQVLLFYYNVYNTKSVN